MTITVERRNMIGGTLAAIAGVALAMIGTPNIASAADLIPFRMGISAPVVSILPVYLAEEGGFYEKQGLKVDIISSEGGTRGVQVLLSGEIQGMHVGLSPVVAANTAGADLRAIASTTNTLPITLFAREKTDPPLPKDASVGISTPGSETDIALSLALAALGVSRDDLNITQIGGSSKRFAAMVAGRIDAAPLLEPAITRALQKGFNPVYDLSANKTPWIFDAVVVTTDYLKAHPDILERFLKAYVEGAYWGLANEGKAKAVISSRFKTDDKDVINTTYGVFKSLMPLDAKPSIEGAKNVISQLKSTGLKVKSEDVNAYVDLQLIDKLQKEGFFDEMQKRYGIH
jgi:ABC-type nitrate/sulfonate/bicarbonate transport system substrate-binding protein